MAKKRQRGRGSGSIYKRPGRKPYYMAWRDEAGKKIVECSGTTDKAAAERILAKRLADVALRRTGVIDARLEAISERAALPIETHLLDFEAMMRGRQRGDGHIGRTLKFIREACKAAQFELASDIDADGVNRYIADRQAAGDAARTVQGRVVACKAFTRWLADHAKLSADPLRSIRRGSVKTDRRHERRMLLPDEWPWLRAAILGDGERNGMAPMERVALYTLAIQTGLRVGELWTLTKARLFLSVKKPFVRVKAGGTKNKQEARQFIDAGLAESLRILTATKTPSARVFGVRAEEDLAETLRYDLADARKMWLSEAKHGTQDRERREASDFLMPTNDQGEALDFHSLRHTCGAWLALRGCQPKVIQTVMRHSTITLTMDTYGHLLPDAVEDAVGKMSGMFGGGGLDAEVG